MATEEDPQAEAEEREREGGLVAQGAVQVWAGRELDWAVNASAPVAVSGYPTSGVFPVTRFYAPHAVQKWYVNDRVCCQWKGRNG